MVPEPATAAPEAPQTPDVAPKGKTSGKKATPAKKAPKAATKAKKSRQGSKTETILDLLKRPGGVSAKELMETTGWQAHSVRGFLSGTVGKKMGLTVVSTKGEDGDAHLLDQRLSLAKPLPSSRRIQSRRLFSFLFRFENAQLRRPVRKRQTQTLKIRIASAQLRFDGCDFAAATFHSRRDSNPLGFDFLEGPAIAVERRLLARERLPALDHDIDVLRVQFDAVADALA